MGLPWETQVLAALLGPVTQSCGVLPERITGASQEWNMRRQAMATRNREGAQGRAEHSSIHCPREASCLRARTWSSPLLTADLVTWAQKAFVPMKMRVFLLGLGFCPCTLLSGTILFGE